MFKPRTIICKTEQQQFRATSYPLELAITVHCVCIGSEPSFYRESSLNELGLGIDWLLILPDNWLDNIEIGMREEIRGGGRKKILLVFSR